jgi:iron complex transport system substrate-binding protein
VLFVVWHDPLISVGRNTFLADALRWAGAELAVESDREWPQLNLEEVMRVQPDFLVFASAHAAPVKDTVNDLRARPGWRNLEAIRQGRVAVISDAVNRPGPRLVEAIEELARQLHPGAFGTGQETGKGKMENRDLAHGSRFPCSNFHFPIVPKEDIRCSR